ncbi:MAG: hypothetical protein E6Q97_03380 [Desulfurellales bacterium]|nr:MAG: hypothetical protein E6Q97_03380 [Desulfurellales bacterium]
MNLIIPKFSMRRTFDRIWQAVRGCQVAQFVSHEGDLPLAYDLARYERTPDGTMWAPDMAKFLLDRPLCGAGYSFESRRWMHPASDAAIATTGANTVNFNCYDYFAIALIGFYWTVAGTVTAMVMDFDKYPRLFAGGTVVDKLNGTNGVLTAPTVASQAQGTILYKNLGHNPGEIDIEPGNSVQAIVTTTTTAGNGMPFVVGYARAEEYVNLTGEVESA